MNFYLIPEVAFILAGENGFLAALRRRLQSTHNAVVAVAEGAGQELIRDLPAETDASGNKRYADIGVYLKEQIVTDFKRAEIPVEVKYFDPSYFVRSVPANCDDAILCDLFAVHAAMGGKTNLVIGLWNSAFTHVPISFAVNQTEEMVLNSRIDGREKEQLA